jgi:hypothetical protein
MDEKADPPPLGKVVGQGYFPASRPDRFERNFELTIFVLANLVFIALDVWVLRQ